MGLSHRGRGRAPLRFNEAGAVIAPDGLPPSDKALALWLSFNEAGAVIAPDGFASAVLTVRK